LTAPNPAIEFEFEDDLLPAGKYDPDIKGEIPVS
jgi:hypothetical protein